MGFIDKLTKEAGSVVALPITLPLAVIEAIEKAVDPAKKK